MNLLYVSLVDVSQSTGPGTNELEAIHALEKYKNDSDELFFLLPQPRDSLFATGTNYMFFEKKNRIYKGISLLVWQYQYLIQFISIFNNLSKRTTRPKVIIRPDKSGKLLFIPIWLAYKNIPYGLRHVQDQYVFSPKKTLKTRYRNFLLKKGIRKAQYLDSTLEERAKLYSKLSQKRVHIINNAVNLDRFSILDKIESKQKIGIPTDKFVIGYIGGVPLDRGAKELLYSAKDLLKSIPELHILIVGDSKDQKSSHLQKMREIVKMNHLEDKVSLTGIISFTNIVPYFNALDVGVALVPKKEVLEKGNSSQKIYQYIACGVPVIIPTGTHSDLVKRESAFEVEPENYDDFKQKVIALKAHRPSKEDLRQVAFSYSVEKRARYQLELWDNTIN